MIILLGYMGSGKTTLGRSIARSFELPFVDLDTLIETDARMSVSDYFAAHGEEAFRTLELQKLKEVLEGESAVLSTGGGTPTIPGAMELMNQLGLTVYLKGSPKFLASRLFEGQSHRPLIADVPKSEVPEFISNHLIERESFYNQSRLIISLPASKQAVIKDVKAVY